MLALRLKTKGNSKRKSSSDNGRRSRLPDRDLLNRLEASLHIILGQCLSVLKAIVRVCEDYEQPSNASSEYRHAHGIMHRPSLH